MKIKNHKHLVREKQRLLQRQKELEQQILLNWNEFKKDLKPTKIAENLIFDTFRNELNNKKNSLSDKLRHLTTIIMRLALDKIETTIVNWINKKA